MFHGNPSSPSGTLAAADKRALKDAIILLTMGVAAWVLIERTETCTRFFQYVAAHPDMELDSVILAGMFSAIGIVVFALRRWREAIKAERLSNTLAYHDPLTGLANRRAFMEALERLSTRNAAVPFVCILADLDNFSQVNDLRGHMVGDRMLQLISQRLVETLSPNILVARIGGDELGLLCPLDRAPEVANLIVHRVSDPVLIEGDALQVGVSMGVARFPVDADHAHSLLRKADIALYRAKRSGSGQIRFFETDMEEVDRRRALIGEALRNAIPRGEITPHYQPLVDLATGSVVGFEVLSRWTSPTLGSVAPSEFIPIALECGLIGSLSSCILHQACAEAARWPWPLPISFNLAPRQLCDPLLPIQILSILSKTNLSPRRLDIEMTEDALLENDPSALTNLEALKGAGITLTLDDFGNGYSSLHHLRSLPFDKVKIDRSYVSKIASCDKSRRMVEAIVTFIHSLSVPVLAEGVEIPDQAHVLKRLGCDFAQGWLYGKAVANSEIGRYFQQFVRPTGRDNDASLTG